MTTIVHDYTLPNEYADENSVRNSEHESTHEIWIESGSYGE